MQVRPLILFLCFCCGSLIFSGCSSSEIGESKDVSQDKIFQQYHINFKEGEKEVEFFSQFRFAGVKGTTLVLSAPSTVALDGEVLKVDSTTYDGAFYKKMRPIRSFRGPHDIIFTDIKNRKFENRFMFEGFAITDVPKSISRSSQLKMQFDCKPLLGEDFLSISTVDTDSTFSYTYNHTDTSSTILIPASELQRQKGTELKLEAKLYRQYPLQQSTSEGGEIIIRYTLAPLIIQLQ